MFDPCRYDDLLPGDELSFALGKEGATRRKLANASGLDAQPTAKIKLFDWGEGIYMAFTFGTDSPSSCFWRFKTSSNSPLIQAFSSHPCSPSSIGQAASWNILAKSPLWLETDLNVSVHGTARPEAHSNVFIISYHFMSFHTWCSFFQRGSAGKVFFSSNSKCVFISKLHMEWEV